MTSALSLVALAACGDPAPSAATIDQTPLDELDTQSTLQWIAPLSGDQVEEGDPLELAVYTENAAVSTVDFEVDGVAAGTCDPSQPEEDCRDGNVWMWAATLDSIGMHTVAASFRNADGATVRTERVVEVVAAGSIPSDPAGPSDTDSLALDAPGGAALGEEEFSSIVDPLLRRGDGYRDRDIALRSVAGGRHWQIRNMLIKVAGSSSETPRTYSSTPGAACRCALSVGASVSRYSELYGVSNANVIGGLVASGTCGDPGTTRPPLRARVCVAVARASGGEVAGFTPRRPGDPTYSAADIATCRTRMRDVRDFAVYVLTRYLRLKSRGTSAQFGPRRNPILLAATLGAGGARASRRANAWHLAPTSEFIDRYARAYNGFVITESGGGPMPRVDNYDSAFNFDRTERGLGPLRVPLPGAQADAEGSLWPVNPSPSAPLWVRDGTGRPRALLSANSRGIKVNNIGLRRFGGETHVYGFAVIAQDITPDCAAQRRMTGGTAPVVGGWIPLSAIHPDRRDGLRNALAATQTRLDRIYDAAQSVATSGGVTNYRIIGAAGTNPYGELKVRSLVWEANVAARDYMPQIECGETASVVNVTMSLAGRGAAASDTVPTDGSVIFHRLRGVLSVDMPLWEACSATPVSRRQTFLFGYVDGPDGQRSWGWLPDDVLRVM